MTFKHDRIENEKKDPLEASSLKFINVPVFLIAVFIGFGAAYLGLRTKDTSMSQGDSRTNKPQSGTMKADDLVSMMEKGKQVFTTTCQACHQANGQGIPGAFPSLAESEWVNGSPKQVAAIILHGLQGEITVKAQKFQGVMPPFKDQLKPEDVAAVATYIRNSFGNKSEMLTVNMVNEVKQKTANRNSAWNGESELKSQDWK